MSYYYTYYLTKQCVLSTLFYSVEKILYILYNIYMIDLHILKGKAEALALLEKTAAEKFNSFEIVKGQHGKPYLKEIENFCFNISHSGEISVLALSDSEVGVDAEKIKKADLRIAKRCFLQNEAEYILREDSDNRFFEIWTRKEAYLKYKGTGISGGLQSVDTFNCSPDIKTFFIDGYVISVCGDGEVNIIK